MSDCIPRLATSHSPVFLLNSCLDLFAAPHSREDPFSRSYGVNLPSSLTMNLPSALVYSTRPRVSVYGTAHQWVKLSGFSRESDYHRCPIAPGGARYCPVSASAVDLPAADLPTRFNALFRQCADVSLLRLHIAPVSGNGILTVCPSSAPCGYDLGPDLP